MNRRSHQALLAALLLGFLGAMSVSSASAMPLPVTERVVIGHSVQGREIVAYHRFTAGRVGSKPFLVLGQMHGNEESGKRVVAALRSRVLPANLDLWVIPTLNPDGDLRDTRRNARGVDLNRNFPESWVKQGAGTSYYAGPSPASEPETRALRDFVLAVQPWRTVSFHTPLYGVDKGSGKDPALARDLASWSGYPLRSFTCNSGCRGTMTQFVNARTSGSAVTFEFGRSTTTAQLNRVIDAVIRVGASR